MPPKSSPEKIAAKLGQLKVYVNEHATRLSSRLGHRLKQKLDQRFSKEEQRWYNFLVTNEKRFNAAHDELITEMFDLLERSLPPTVAGFDVRIREVPLENTPWTVVGLERIGKHLFRVDTNPVGDGGDSDDEVLEVERDLLMTLPQGEAQLYTLELLEEFSRVMQVERAGPDVFRMSSHVFPDVFRMSRAQSEVELHGLEMLARLSSIAQASAEKCVVQPCAMEMAVTHANTDRTFEEPARNLSEPCHKAQRTDDLHDDDGLHEGKLRSIVEIRLELEVKVRSAARVYIARENKQDTACLQPSRGDEEAAAVDPKMAANLKGRQHVADLLVDQIDDWDALIDGCVDEPDMRDQRLALINASSSGNNVNINGLRVWHRGGDFEKHITIKCQGCGALVGNGEDFMQHCLEYDGFPCFLHGCKEIEVVFEIGD